MHRSPGAPASTFMLWVTSGSRHEAEEEAGTSHLLEHLLLESRFQSSSIIDQLESLGIEANGFTGKEHTVLFSRQPPDLCSQATEILAEAILNPSLDASLLDREREIVLQEIRANESEASDYVFELFHGATFLPNAIARPTTGTPHSVRKLTIDSATEFHRQRFHSGTVRAIVTGDFSPGQILDSLANGPLSSLTQGQWLPIQALQGITSFSPDYSRKFDDDYSYVVFGFEVPSGQDVHRPAFEVLDVLIAGFSPSVLFKAIRTQEALSYEVWSELIFYTDRGVWLAFISTPTSNVDKVIEIAQNALDKAFVSRWDDKQITGAINHAASKLIIQSDPSSGHAMKIGLNRVTFGLEDWSIKNHVESIRQINATQLNEVIDELSNKPPVIAVCGGTTGFKTGFLGPWQS